MDSVLGGWPIKNVDGEIIGYHNADGEEFYDGYTQKKSDCPYYREYHHESLVKTYWGTSYPVVEYIHHRFPCPLCGGYTQSYSDCPGYGNPVMVCGDGYSDETITGKDVYAQACGNADLFVCINPDCDWEWRVPNHRGKNGQTPSWKNEAIDYIAGRYEDDEED